MLQKIISIKNIGRFRHAAATGDVTFRRYTLICAENGRGKTTLCAILRSLLTNSPEFVIGRKTLGSTDNPEIQLLLANGSKTFRNGAWSDSFPDIAIFDGTYVTDNVFAGDVVETEHRRNLYRVIIGAGGVTAASRLNELDGLIRAKNREINDARTAIQQHIPARIVIESFITLAPVDDVDNRINALEQERQAVQRVAQLRQKSGLAAIPVPLFPPSFAELLAKTFATLAASAEQEVTEHLTRHRMQADGERWLNQGLPYVVDNACPFCGQSLTGISLVQAYGEFFNREYNALSSELSTFGTHVNAAIGERTAVAIQNLLTQNSSSLEFWSAYCPIEPPVLADAARVEGIWSALTDAAQALLTTKAATPLTAVAPTERFTHALQEFETLRRSLMSYNAAVNVANAVIDAKKQEAQTASLADVETSLATLKAQKARHTDEVNRLCANEARLQQEKIALEREKTQAREQLDLHTQQVISLYGDSINRYLERINAGFRITPPTHNYRGGTPNTTYQILINQHAVDLGDAQTPANRPSFRNTLSAGDKGTLALAFFFAQLEHDANGSQKIVVVDDPFSSLDNFRRHHTAQHLVKCGERCVQMIVLSHEPSFLKLVWERCPNAETKCLQLTRIGEENTTIAPWDIERALQGRYHADLQVLSTYFSEGQGEPRDVVQKLRPVLESFCRNALPTQFGEQNMMGDIIATTRTAGASHYLHSIVDDLDEINVYCRRYHHGENPHAAAEVLDPAELTDYVRKTLRMVGCLI